MLLKDIKRGVLNWHLIVDYGHGIKNINARCVCPILAEQAQRIEEGKEIEKDIQIVASNIIMQNYTTQDNGWAKIVYAEKLNDKEGEKQ